MSRCGARASVCASGLAVPISMPRYTMAESTETISAPRVSTRDTASPVLPDAVGPIRKTTPSPVMCTSLSPHEQAIQRRQINLHPARPTMIAVSGARGSFHVTQQGVHFRQAQTPARLDGGPAAHVGKQIIDR